MTLPFMDTAPHPRGARIAPRFAHEGIAFGCDYNPEQWSRETWREDMALMREAGVDLVAINIFGWAEIQRPDGSFDFTRLDEVVALLHESGIRINLGTGTSSPPPWLTTRHPEILPVVADGTTRYPGGRQAWCPSSPVFRAAALEVVEAVAQRYGDHDAVELWHVSNELGCHNVHCHCDVSAAAFRVWLERRYGTIDGLNAAWGTAFWSQRYTDWNEILTPRLTLSTRNPSQLLDYRRFSSDALLEYYRAEAAIIRRHSAKPITTNFMVTAHIDGMDYATWASDMDVIANDHYLDHRLPDPHGELSFAADLVRGLAGGAPWLLMEHSTGAVNWQPVNPAKAPGQMMRDTLVHVARGADAACFFQWRASLQGSEKYHSALLPHAGTDTAQWREVRELGTVIGALGEVQGSRVVADAAVLFSWPSWWATDAENSPSSAVGYLDQVHAAHRALRDAGITADVVDPERDLRGYRLIVVPGLHVVTDAAAERLREAVASGAHTLVTFFSGIVDEHDRVRPGGYPAPWRELLGVRVVEFTPTLPDAALTLASGAGARLWAERVVAVDAEIVDRFADGPARGLPALTRRAGEGGAGDAWYLATLLDGGDYTRLVSRIAEAAGLAPEAGAGRDVEVVRRKADDGTTWRFVINHGTEGVDIVVRGTDLVAGVSVDGATTIPGGTVGIFREERA
ncbi:beta-galactosidase [Microbacterium sp. 10M-3C3]|jgi:beta-galactosidase|uniref:beta-galactosidase n=1 Tax=Microbacterium sp. 10M-3C3 TaxID=2483401 RepID=UPI001F0CD7B5|nr:beta-galactosidase [Microbacterium sp. 10M-3C3]